MNVKLSPIILALLSGALLAGAYRIPGLWMVSFVALVPLFLAVYGARSVQTAVWAGMITGVIAMGTATSWFFAILPLSSSFGVTNDLAGIVFVTFSWVLVTLVISAPLGLFAGLARSLTPARIPDALALAVLYAACEYLRLYTFNALTMNYGVSNPAFFSVGSIAWPLMDSINFAQLAAWGGLYLISFVVVLINVAFFVCIHMERRGRAIFGAGLMISLIVLIAISPIVNIRASFYKEQTEDVRVGIVSIAHDPDLSQGIGQAKEREEALTFVRDASAQGALLMVLPESMHLFIPFAPHTAGEYFSASSTPTVVDSGIFRSPDGTRPVRAFAHTRAGTVAIRDKVVLTPQGEYLPYLFRLFLRALGARNAEEKFDSVRNFATGQGDGRAVAAGPVRASVLFCLEVMDPGLGLHLAGVQGSNLIVVAASHSWFGDSPSLERDTMRFAKLQAIEAGLPLVTSQIHGIAYVLDRYGRIQSRVGGGEKTEWRVVSVPIVP